MGIGAGGGIDTFDHVVDPGAALVRDDFRLGPEPTLVRCLFRDDQGRSAVARAPADDLVDDEGVCVGRLGRDPGMHAENAAPGKGPGRVDLNDRFPGHRRVGRDAQGLPAGRAPIRHDGMFPDTNGRTDHQEHEQPLRPNTHFPGLDHLKD